MVTNSDSVQSEDVKLLYFELILEHILFLFVTHLLAARLVFCQKRKTTGNIWRQCSHAGFTHKKHTKEKHSLAIFDYFS